MSWHLDRLHLDRYFVGRSWKCYMAIIRSSFIADMVRSRGWSNIGTVPEQLFQCGHGLSVLLYPNTCNILARLATISLCVYVRAWLLACEHTCNDSKLKPTLERFAWNDATFRSVTTDIGHACLWQTSVTWPRYRQKDLGVDGGQLVSLITIHGGTLLFDVNSLLDFTSVPLLFSAEHPGIVLGHRVAKQCSPTLVGLSRLS